MFKVVARACVPIIILSLIFWATREIAHAQAPLAVAPVTTYAIDWGPVLNDILLAVAALVTAILGTLGTIITAKLKAKYNIDVSTARTAQVEDAAGKSMAWAIMQASNVIKAYGWDHGATQSAITAQAANYFLSRFPEAAAATGLDISTPAARSATASRLDATIMTRLLPAAMATAAASPATPSAPPAAANLTAVAAAAQAAAARP